MSTVFNVLIYDSQTAEFLEECRSFFEPFLEKGAFAYCRWNPDGMNIEQALPDLYDAVKKEVSWRAVILHHGLAEPRTNPFDFLEGSETGDETENVPLIRLTHMLSQVPARIELHTHETEDGVVKKEMVDNSKEYSNSYALSCHKPRSLILVATRKKDMDESGVRPEEYHELRFEPQYSEFWSRNEYPANTRFVVYDLEYFQGTIQKKAIFNFTFAILTLLLNEVSSSALAAYKLYRVGICLDEKVLQDVIADFYARQITIQNAVLRFKEALHQEEMHPHMGSMPNMDEIYRADFPADALKSLLADEGAYGLVSDHPVSEFTRWSAEMSRVKKNWEEFRKKPPRYLRQTLARIKDNESAERFDGEYTPDQLEDLREKMEYIEKEMFNLELAGSSDYRKELEARKRSDKRVNDYIMNRLTRKQVWGAGAVIIFIFLCSFVPFLWRALGDDYAFPQAIAVVLSVMVTMAFAGLIWLIVSHFKLVNKIKYHNEIIRDIVWKSRNNQEKYGEYLSHAFNYMKYWKIMKEQQKRADTHQNIRHYLKFHEASANRALQLCERMRVVYQLVIRPDYNRYRPELFQLDKDATGDGYYRIEAEKLSHRIPINQSGETVYGPYGFITKFYLEREDVFDD